MGGRRQIAVEFPRAAQSRISRINQSHIEVPLVDLGQIRQRAPRAVEDHPVGQVLLIEHPDQAFGKMMQSAAGGAAAKMRERPLPTTRKETGNQGQAEQQRANQAKTVRHKCYLERVTPMRGQRPPIGQPEQRGC